MARPRIGAAFYAWLRDRWAAGLALRSDISLILVASLAWTVLYNLQFWHQAIAAMWHPTPGARAVPGFSVHRGRVSARHCCSRSCRRASDCAIAASALFLIAAISSYFASAYGAVMNQEMMRNVIETDPAEVGGFMSFDLFAHVMLLGVLPAVLVWRVTLPSSTWRVQLRQRLAFIGSALALCAVALFSCSANYAVFFRAHKPIRYALSPAAPVVSFIGLLSAKESRDPHAPLIDPAGNVQRIAAVGDQAAGAVPGSRRDSAGREFPARRLCARDEPGAAGPAGRRVLRSCNVVRHVDGNLGAVHLLPPAARALQRRSGRPLHESARHAR